MRTSLQFLSPVRRQLPNFTRIAEGVLTAPNRFLGNSLFSALCLMEPHTCAESSCGSKKEPLTTHHAPSLDKHQHKLQILQHPKFCQSLFHLMLFLIQFTLSSWTFVFSYFLCSYFIRIRGKEYVLNLPCLYSIQ